MELRQISAIALLVYGLKDNHTLTTSVPESIGSIC